MHKLRVDEGELRKLGLVDVGDDQLVRGRELGLRAREELVKVLCCFATLEERDTGEGFTHGAGARPRSPHATMAAARRKGVAPMFHTQSGRLRDVR